MQAERVAALLGCKKDELGKLLCDAALHPIEPVVSNKKAPCQEIIHRVTDKDFDLFKLIPAPTNTPVDAGRYFSLGMFCIFVRICVGTEAVFYAV